VACLAFGATTTAADAKEAEGQIVDFAITPPAAPVTAGDTITWTNSGNRPHTVTDRGGVLGTGEIQPGAQAVLRFDVPGSYQLFCEINPSLMNATVVVQPGDEPPSELRIQAVDEAREGETKRFDPPELEVAAGTRLTLANVGGLPHSLVAEDGSFRTEIVQPGAEEGRFAGTNASVVVSEPGTYPFFCEIHPAVMRGTLTVTEVADVADRAPPDSIAAGPDPPAADEETDGTLVAYVIAALVLGVGALGLGLGLRKPA
jgi:plastocyanin